MVLNTYEMVFRKIFVLYHINYFPFSNSSHSSHQIFTMIHFFCESPSIGLLTCSPRVLL